MSTPYRPVGRKWNGGVLCKKVDFSRTKWNETGAGLIFLFYILLTWGSAYAPPAYRPAISGTRAPSAWSTKVISCIVCRGSVCPLSYLAMLQFLHFEAHVIFLERIKIAISKFVCRFIAIDVDKHSNTETDTVITIIRSPYRGRSKNTWLLGEPHPLLANVAFLEHLFCTTRSHLCPNPAIYMYILLYYYIIMSTSLYPLLYLDAWYGLQSSTFKLLEMNSRLRLECSSTERCQFRAMWLLSCVNMTSSIKPEVHNIATPPEDRATECTDR